MNASLLITVLRLNACNLMKKKPATFSFTLHSVCVPTELYFGCKFVPRSFQNPPFRHVICKLGIKIKLLKFLFYFILFFNVSVMGLGVGLV